MRAPPEQQTITTRTALVQRALDRAGDFLADHHAHAAADEGVLHRRDDRGDAVDPSRPDDERVLEAGRGPRRRQPFLVRLGIGELERIGRDQTLVVLDPDAVIEERAQPLDGADAEVVGAFRTDVQVRREILVVDDLRTAGTLDPQALRHAAGLDRGRGGDRRARLLEPGHGVSLSNTGYGLLASVRGT